VLTASTAHIAANNSTAFQRLWHMAYMIAVTVDEAAYLGAQFGRPGVTLFPLGSRQLLQNRPDRGLRIAKGVQVILEFAVQFDGLVGCEPRAHDHVANMYRVR